MLAREKAINFIELMVTLYECIDDSKKVTNNLPSSSDIEEIAIALKSSDIFDLYKLVHSFRVVADLYMEKLDELTDELESLDLDGLNPRGSA